MYRLLKVFPLISLLLVGSSSCRHNSQETGAAAPTGITEPTFKFELASHGLPEAKDPPNDRTLGIQEAAGTGLGLADFDGDGVLDLLIPRAPVCALFRGTGGRGWISVAGTSGLASAGPAQGCAIADVDNDGRPDILLTGLNGLLLLRNLGHMRFAKVTGTNLPRSGWFTSAAFTDLNRDGLADLYAGGFVQVGENSPEFVIVGHSAEKGDRVVGTAPSTLYPAHPGRLFLNQGRGVFTDVTSQWKVASAGRTLGVLFSDVNLDGWPDLFLSNDAAPSELFLNQQGRGMALQQSPLSPAYGRDGEIVAMRGCDAGDVDGDGHPDLTAGAEEDHGLVLFRKTDDGYEERGLRSGLGSSRPFSTNGVALADLDSDGWEDLVAVNGSWVTNSDRISRFPGAAQPLQLFRNVAGRFTSEQFEASGGGNSPMLGRGLAVGDLDNDGAIDLVIGQLDGSPLVLRNRGNAGAHWLRIKLHGKQSGRDALGARVVLKSTDRNWLREVRQSRGYLSSSDPRITVGLGNTSRIEALRVHWPSGKVSTLSGLDVDKEIEVSEP